MKIRLNPFLLGIFVIGGVAIAIAALLGLGSSLFKPVGHFVFYLPDSAGALTEGGAVKLNGVMMGKIDRIAAYYNPETRKSFVGVTCEINKDLLSDSQGHPISLKDPKSLQNLVSKGLTVQVQTAGLVGNEYVELGFNASKKPIHLTDLPASPNPVIPAIPSQMSQLTDDISGILSNLHQIDYNGLVKQANGVLVAVHEQVGELQTNHLTDHISTAAESVGNFVSSPDMQSAVKRLQGAISTFQGFMTNLNAQVAPAGTNLNATLVSAKESLATIQDFLKLHNQLGEQTYQLMDQLNETARSIEQLSDFLQQHPNALITGRAKQNDAP